MRKVGLRLWRVLTWPFRELWGIVQAWVWVWKTSGSCDYCYAESGGLALVAAYFYCKGCWGQVCRQHGAAMLEMRIESCCEQRKLGLVEERGRE